MEKQLFILFILISVGCSQLEPYTMDKHVPDYPERVKIGKDGSYEDDHYYCPNGLKNQKYHDDCWDLDEVEQGHW